MFSSAYMSLLLYSVYTILERLELVGQHYSKCIFVKQNYVFREKARHQTYFLGTYCKILLSSYAYIDEE